MLSETIVCGMIYVLTVFSLFRLIVLISGTVFVVHWWLPPLSFVVYINYILIIFISYVMLVLNSRGEGEAAMSFQWLEKVNKFDN